jgi:hypothetical protein
MTPIYSGQKDTEMECQFCKSKDVELHEVEGPAIRLCGPCREKLGTHIAVVCTGCDTVYWLLKTPANIMQASAMSDLSPVHIMDNYLIHEIKTCKRCFKVAKGYTVEGKWLN